jgi:uncharacterized membrane protein
MTYTEKITDLFLLIALSFGLVLVFLVPPFQSPDETNHFKRAYQLSKGQFFSDKTENRIGGYLPKSIDVLCDTFLYLKNDVKAKISFSQLQTVGQMPLEADKLQFSDFPNTAIYAPIGYIPQAIGIALLRWADAPVLYLLYAARICNLLVWCMLIWFSLRTIHFGRPLLAVLALLPSSLAIASSANPDVLCNALSWYLIACVLANLPWSRLGVIAYWMLCLQKLIAWPLGLLLLGKLEWRRASKYGTIWVLGVGLALALAWGNYAQTSFISYDEYDPEWRDRQTLNPGVNPQKQLGFIIEQPIFLIKTISKSMLYAIPSMAAHVVGKFGWEKNYLPAPVLALLWLAILGLAFSEKWKAPLVVKLWAGAAVAAYWLAFSVTMYALWCPVGADILDNWQARYFTPILPLCFLLIAQDYLSHWRKLVITAALGMVIMGNVILIWSVWMRYVV